MQVDFLIKNVKKNIRNSVVNIPWLRLWVFPKSRFGVFPKPTSPMSYAASGWCHKATFQEKPAAKFVLMTFFFGGGGAHPAG